jgi:hypothetical protein
MPESSEEVCWKKRGNDRSQDAPKKLAIASSNENLRDPKTACLIMTK